MTKSLFGISHSIDFWLQLWYYCTNNSKYFNLVHVTYLLVITITNNVLPLYTVGYSMNTCTCIFFSKWLLAKDWSL